MSDKTITNVKYKFTVRIISAYLIFSFITTSSVGSATVTPSPIQIAPLGEISNRSEFQVSEFNIPEELGRVEAVTSYSNGKHKAPVIIHIRDAHGSYEAQIHTMEIIEHLAKIYGIKTLFLEGASAPLEPQQLDLFDDQSLNFKIADHLAKSGELSGAELFMIKNLENSEIRAIGVEDLREFASNLSTFKGVAAKRSDVDEFLKMARSQIEVVGSKNFNKDLKDFLRSWMAWREERLDLIGFVGLSKRVSMNHLKLDLSHPKSQIEYPMLVRFFKAQEIESKIKIPDAKSELAMLSSVLGVLNVPTEIVDTLRSWKLEEGLSGFGTELPRAFLERLYEALLPYHFQFEDFPELTKVFAMLIFQSEIDGQTLFSEIDKLIDSIFTSLIKSNEERALVELIQKSILLEKLLKLELIRDEVGLAMFQKDELSPVSIVNELLRWRNVDPKFYENTIDLESTFESAIQFYRGALAREAHFIDNTKNTMSELNESAAILITGGFHSDGLRERFEKEKFSYIEVSPRISSVEGVEKIYLESMLGTRQTMFDQAKIRNVLATVSKSELRELNRLLYGNNLAQVARAEARREEEVLDAVLNHVTDPKLLTRSRSEMRIAELHGREELILKVLGRDKYRFSIANGSIQNPKLIAEARPDLKRLHQIASLISPSDSQSELAKQARDAKTLIDTERQQIESSSQKQRAELRNVSGPRYQVDALRNIVKILNDEPPAKGFPVSVQKQALDDLASIVDSTVGYRISMDALFVASEKVRAKRVVVEIPGLPDLLQKVNGPIAATWGNIEYSPTTKFRFTELSNLETESEATQDVVAASARSELRWSDFFNDPQFPETVYSLLVTIGVSSGLGVLIGKYFSPQIWLSTHPRQASVEEVQSESNDTRSELRHITAEFEFSKDELEKQRLLNRLADKLGIELPRVVLLRDAQIANDRNQRRRIIIHAESKVHTPVMTKALILSGRVLVAGDSEESVRQRVFELTHKVVRGSGREWDKGHDGNQPLRYVEGNNIIKVESSAEIKVNNRLIWNGKLLSPLSWKRLYFAEVMKRSRPPRSYEVSHITHEKNPLTGELNIVKEVLPGLSEYDEGVPEGKEEMFQKRLAEEVRIHGILLERERKFIEHMNPDGDEKGFPFVTRPSLVVNPANNRPQLWLRFERPGTKEVRSSDLIIQIARTLDRAHRYGVVHNDVGLPNIIITDQGGVLLDWALSFEAHAREDLARLKRDDGLTSRQLSIIFNDSGVVVKLKDYLKSKKIKVNKLRLPFDARRDLVGIALMALTIAENEEMSGGPIVRSTEFNDQMISLATRIINGILRGDLELKNPKRPMVDFIEWVQAAKERAEAIKVRKDGVVAGGNRSELRSDDARETAIDRMDEPMMDVLDILSDGAEGYSSAEVKQALKLAERGFGRKSMSKEALALHDFVFEFVDGNKIEAANILKAAVEVMANLESRSELRAIQPVPPVTAVLPDRKPRQDGQRRSQTERMRSADAPEDSVEISEAGKRLSAEAETQKSELRIAVAEKAVSNIFAVEDVKNLQLFDLSIKPILDAIPEARSNETVSVTITKAGQAVADRISSSFKNILGLSESRLAPSVTLSDGNWFELVLSNLQNLLGTDLKITIAVDNAERKSSIKSQIHQILQNIRKVDSVKGAEVGGRVSSAIEIAVGKFASVANRKAALRSAALAENEEQLEGLGDIFVAFANWNGVKNKDTIRELTIPILTAAGQLAQALENKNPEEQERLVSQLKDLGFAFKKAAGRTVVTILLDRIEELYIEEQGRLAVSKSA